MSEIVLEKKQENNQVNSDDLKEKLLLVDGNSIMNRAFYGIMGTSLMKNKEGQYTNAVYGFLNVLFKVLEDEKPHFIAITFDISRPKHRVELYKEYKGNRDKSPEELKSQFPIIKQILKDMNIAIVEKQDFEADDLLRTLSKTAEDEGFNVVILSGDRDTYQLATDNISILMPKTKGGKTSNEKYDRKRILQEYGIEPEKLKDVKGLQGDTSDNIPGVSGIGEKTALKLIKQYDSIENLYDAIEKNEDDLKGAARLKIINGKKLAFLSKELGTILRDVPLDVKISELDIKPWDKKKVLEDFKRYDFKRYISRFNLEGQEEIPDLFMIANNETQIKQERQSNLEKMIDFETKSVEEVLEFVQKSKKIYYEIKTKQDNTQGLIYKKQIEEVIIYDSNINKGYKIELGVIENSGIYEIANIEKENINEQNKNYKIVKQIFEDENIKKYSSNIGDQYILFKQIGITICGIYYDTQIAAYVLDSTIKNNSLDDLSQKYLNKEILKIYNEDKVDYSNSRYLLECAKTIYDLVPVLDNELSLIKSTLLYKDIEIPTIEILAQMQWNGIYVDKNELEEFGKELSQKLKVLEGQICVLADEDFNVNSPKQLGKILFDKLELPVIKKTKTGYSTDTSVLEKLKEKTNEPILDCIIDYRAYQKLYSTYVEGLLPYINPLTHKIHSKFTQTVTATGRISCIDPNLQSIPTRTELGKQLRKVFKAEPGTCFVDGDYSQIELRVLASVSQDDAMVDAFAHDEDIHKIVASKVFDVPLEEVTSDQRSHAKAVNFGIVYGISDYGLAEQLHIKKKQAQELIDQYLSKYDGIEKYLDNIVLDAKEKGYVKTLFNRRRYVPELSSSNALVRNFGKRIAMNSPIQGTAADIMKIAMINIYRYIKENNSKAQIVLQVHDEVIVQVPDDEAHEFEENMKKLMENSVDLNVPLKVNIEIGSNWFECK